MPPTAPETRPSPAAEDRRPARARRGFTLTEILVVIGIIVLLLTISLPAIGYLTGSRSVDGGINVVNSTLAVARNYAISEQRPCGVLFYIEPTSQTVSMAIVHDVSTVTGSPPAAYSLILDRIPDVGVTSLPKGVRVQGCITAPPTGAVRSNDGYLGYNTVTIAINGNTATIPAGQGYGPVILFDGQGKLLATTYMIAGALPVTTAAAPSNWVPSEMAYPLFGLDRSVAVTPGARNTCPPDVIPPAAPVPAPQNVPPSSAVALMVYDEHAFKDQGFSDTDWAIDKPKSAAPHTGAYNDPTGADTNEQAEETWLDQNGTPVLINRYNGTIYKSE